MVCLFRKSCFLLLEFVTELNKWKAYHWETLFEQLRNLLSVTVNVLEKLMGILMVFHLGKMKVFLPVLHSEA